MAIRIWRGDAPAISQVTRLTPGSVEVGDVFNITINGKTISFTATIASLANVAQGLAAAWNVSTIPECSEITATVQGNVCDLTANTPSQPFTISASTVNGGVIDTQTLVANTIVAASGPNFWNVAQNWSGGNLPVSGDDVYLADSAVDILYGLDQAAIAVNSLHIDQSFTGQIGLPTRNETGYAEYRLRYLRIAAATIEIGRNSGRGSARIQLDTGSTATTISVYNTGSAADAGGAVLWKGTSTAAALHLFRGTVGIAVQPDESATLGTLRIAPETNAGGEAEVVIGPGVTITGGIEKGGGSLRFAGLAIAELLQHDGSTTIDAGNIAALRVRGGTVVYNSTGTLGGAVVSAAGKLDFSHDLREKIVGGAIEVYGAAAKIVDPYQVVNNLTLDLNETAPTGLDIGANIRLVRSNLS